MVFQDLISAIWPKVPDAQESTVMFQWRQNVAIGLILGGCAMTLQMAWFLGGLAWLGISGFATAAEAQSTNQIVMAIREDQITNAIVAARTRQCVAIMEGNAFAMQDSFERVRAQLATYYKTTKKEFPKLPECAELLPSAPNAPVAGPIPRDGR